MGGGGRVKDSGRMQFGQRPELGRYGQGPAEVQARRCNACLKRGRKAFARECAVANGDSFVPFSGRFPCCRQMKTAGLRSG